MILSLLACDRPLTFGGQLVVAAIIFGFFGLVAFLVSRNL